MKRWIGLIVFLVLAMLGALVGYVVTAPAPALQYTVVRGDTLGEIAQDLGITAERVRQLQNAALGRIKRPGKLRRLQAFVE